MRASSHGRSAAFLVRMCAIGGLCVSSLLLSGHDARGGPPSRSNTQEQGDGQAGRMIFNGKGLCYYCHGVDGARDKVPHLEGETAAVIARLNPPPADLRNANSLKLKTDKARAKVIREGHEGTGMFPDTALTDQEIADTLAYLALLRRDGPRPDGASTEGR